MFEGRPGFLHGCDPVLAGRIRVLLSLTVDHPTFGIEQPAYVSALSQDLQARLALAPAFGQVHLAVSCGEGGIGAV